MASYFGPMDDPRTRFQRTIQPYAQARRADDLAAAQAMETQKQQGQFGLEGLRQTGTMDLQKLQAANDAANKFLEGKYTNPAFASGFDTWRANVGGVKGSIFEGLPYGYNETPPAQYDPTTGKKIAPPVTPNIGGQTPSAAQGVQSAVNPQPLDKNRWRWNSSRGVYEDITGGR